LVDDGDHNGITSMNLLHNHGFEVDWSEGKSHRCLRIMPDETIRQEDIGNIFTPPGWLTWFLHEPGMWDQPEVRDAQASHDPRRVRSGQKGILLFTYYRRHNAGFLQRVHVTPGARLGLSAWAHAWSNGYSDAPHNDDARWSEGAGYDIVAWPEGDQSETGDPQQDARCNFVFRIGIDTKGGMDPFADSVVWSQGWHIYNGYGNIAVEATAESDMITVFLQSSTRWAFKHNDAYWDDVSLEVIDQEPAGATKLGAHVIRGCSGLGEYIAAKPAVAKFVGDWGLATSVPDGTLVIGRKHQGDYDAQQQYKAGLSPHEAANQFIQDQSSTYNSNPQITYWEGHNEPVWNTHEEMAWYAQFEVERMEIMSNMGLRCVIGNFATGTPALDLWEQFWSACKEARRFKALLGLHEYSCPWMWWMTGRYQLDPDEDQGDEGWTTLRYRKVYRQYLAPNDAVIPLVITECGIDGLVRPLPDGAPGATWKGLGDYWREHDGETDRHDYYFRQLAWYDRELQKDDYVVGATVFTWGNYGEPWASFDVAGTPVADKLTAYTMENPAEPFVYPDGESVPPNRGEPRIDYERTYVLLPPGAGLEWGEAAMSATWDDYRYTIGGSADDGGIGDLSIRNILAINPERWSADLRDFYEAHYPGINYTPINAATPAELAVLLRKPTSEVSLCQRNSLWADDDLGETPGGETIGEAGCLLTSLAMILRRVYGTDVTPPVLNRALAAAGTPFTQDDLLTEWDEAIKLFPKFTGSVKNNRSPYTRLELEGLLADGCHVVLRVRNGAHFVLLDHVANNNPTVIDPWDGTVKQWLMSDISGVRAACVSPSTPPFTLRGINDPDRQGAEQWLVQHGGGWLYVPLAIDVGPMTADQECRLGDRLDFSSLPGCRVVVNLRYSWAKPNQGTFPPATLMEQFCNGCIWCIDNAKNVWGWSIGNEPNNPREWPGTMEVTPRYTAEIYDYIALRRGSVCLAPSPIDPFYGPGSNCGDWFAELWDRIDGGADFVDLHGYIRGPNPSLCWSDARFGDDPLRWQGLNYPLCCQTLLERLPGTYDGLPAIVSECNHLWKTKEPDWGWVDDERAADVVTALYERTREWGARVVALCLYRWRGDEWAIADNEHVLNALERIV
jgi:hypothetical protein